jgi:hypothetical protein
VQVELTLLYRQVQDSEYNPGKNVKKALLHTSSNALHLAWCHEWLGNRFAKVSTEAFVEESYLDSLNLVFKSVVSTDRRSIPALPFVDVATNSNWAVS